MKELAFQDIYKESIEQLKKGAFLTVQAGDDINTMTIGWGMIGFIWSKPIFQVLVRKSRYTYDLIEKSDNFTISFPVEGQDLKKELGICGVKSGRDINKFETCHLTPVKAQKVATPIIEQCGLHYECKIVAKQVLHPEDINEKERNACYSNNDYHTMYYGEIVAVYSTVECNS